MKGFPLDAWVLLIVAVVPGMTLAIWNAARGRRGGETPTGKNPMRPSSRPPRRT